MINVERIVCQDGGKEREINLASHNAPTELGANITASVSTDNLSFDTHALMSKCIY